MDEALQTPGDPMRWLRAKDVEITAKFVTKLLEDEGLGGEEMTLDQRIRDLLPEMQKRYETTKTLLEQAAGGQEVPAHLLWLAQADLQAVLSVMVSGQADFEDEVLFDG